MRIRTLLATLLSSLAFVAACSSTPEDEAPAIDEPEGEPENTGEVSQAVTHSCAQTSDTGYTNGKATPITLVTVQGRRVELGTADAYMAMADAAAAQGVNITITSGFRTNAEQQYLYNCYRNCNCNSCNLAARPGYSNHQSGHALDLNTATPGVAAWLNAHGAAYGFRRTVPSELWHWEWWGGGPGTQTCGSCDRSAGGFTFSCDGPNAGKTCVKVDEPADKNSWADNHVCTDKDIGMKWSSNGPIAGMRCTNVAESADEVASAWADNFLCVPEDSEHVLTWSSAGPLAGKSCFNWNETLDKGSWGDNYLCVNATSDFRSDIFTFSADGPNKGQVCVSVDEPADPNTWADNFLCSDVDVGFKWSNNGTIAGMKCVNVAESAEHDPAIWADNFLCLPQDSKYEMTWSSAGKIKGESCVRFYEAADAKGSWADNYLCLRPANAPPGTPMGTGAAPSSETPGAGGAGAAEDGEGEAATASESAGGCSLGARSSGGTGGALAAMAGLGLAVALTGRRRARRSSVS